MIDRLNILARVALNTAIVAAIYSWSSVPSAGEYKPIMPTMESTTIMLTGHDLTIQQVNDVARHGAHVKFSQEAIDRTVAGRSLVQEGDAEGLAIYLTNRGPGAQREVRHAPA